MVSAFNRLLQTQPDSLILTAPHRSQPSIFPLFTTVLPKRPFHFFASFPRGYHSFFLSPVSVRPFILLRRSAWVNRPSKAVFNRFLMPADNPLAGDAISANQHRIKRSRRPANPVRPPLVNTRKRRKKNQCFQGFSLDGACKSLYIQGKSGQWSTRRIKQGGLYGCK